jgi:hypothetical protein
MIHLEVRYPSGETHEVKLESLLVTVGRDPGSDLVLNDIRCSRRHAVVEEGPEGITIRDSGSANGVYVNGVKVDRAPLRPGDLVQLGDVQLTVLPRDLIGTLAEEPATAVDAEATLMMDSAPTPEGDLMPTEPVGGPAPPPLPPVPGLLPTLPESRVRPAAAVVARPLTVTLLSLLWMISVPLNLLSCILLGLGASGRGGGAVVLGAVCGLAFAAVGTAMALGLWKLRSWARALQIALAGIGILNCPFAPAAVTTLVYMLRAEVAAAFEGRPAPEKDPREGVFAAVLVGCVLLGGVVSLALVFFVAYLGGRPAAF